MVQRRSPARTRALVRMGEHLRSWRKLQGMSASELARRAHITRETLRGIEDGTGSPRIDSLFAVASVLGVVDTLVTALDPLTTDAGRALAIEGPRPR